MEPESQRGAGRRRRRRRPAVRVLGRHRHGGPDGGDVRPGADGASGQGAVPVHRPRDRRAVAGGLPVDVSGHGADAAVRRPGRGHPRLRAAGEEGVQPPRGLRRRDRRRRPARGLLPPGQRAADEPGEGPARRVGDADAVQPQRRVHRTGGAWLPGDGPGLPLPGAGVRRADPGGASAPLVVRRELLHVGPRPDRRDGAGGEGPRGQLRDRGHLDRLADAHRRGALARRGVPAGRSEA